MIRAKATLARSVGRLSRATGRGGGTTLPGRVLLRLDPAGRVTVVLDGLAFANGVVLAADASFVLVAETAARLLDRLTEPA